MIDQLSRTLERSGIAPRLQASRLESFDPARSPGGQAAVDWARANVSEPHSGLLAGTVGTGKSHLVCGLMAARAAVWLERYPDQFLARRRGEDLWQSTPFDHYDSDIEVMLRPDFGDLFVDVPEMLDVMRRWIARPEGGDPLERYARASVLILDDLGREKVTDWATERLYVLVNARYGDLLPTIATSNLRPNELAKSGYEPIVRRLLDGRPAIWLQHKAST
jgi:DNA replication protein DnaC